MVRDTFRQAAASRLLAVMLGLTGLCVVFCLGVSVSGVEEREKHPDELPLYVPRSQADEKVREEGITVPAGEVSLGFGLARFEVTKNRADAVRLIQVWLAGVLADTAGVLLALVWTAGFLPAFLDPQAATVLLAKPTRRGAVLAGKYLGVVGFVGLQAVAFTAGTWLALGVGTGVWDGAYWLAAPLLVVHFAVFYAVSSFLAVCTRSTAVCVFGTLLFWLLCWAMNLTHHRLGGAEVPGVAPLAGTLIDAWYWVLPKPLDLGGIFFDALRAADHAAAVPEVAAAKARGDFHPELAVLTSVLFAVGLLAVAAHEFKTQDY
jgi:hypothetical protein